MGCCFSNPVDFDGEVTLYHFDLLRAVGKGAFGKVFISLFIPLYCSLTPFLTGARCPAQALKKDLRPQVHRQESLSSTEGCSQHHPRTQTPGRGSDLGHTT